MSANDPGQILASGAIGKLVPLILVSDGGPEATAVVEAWRRFCPALGTGFSSAIAAGTVEEVKPIYDEFLNGDFWKRVRPLDVWNGGKAWIVHLKSLGKDWNSCSLSASPGRQHLDLGVAWFSPVEGVEMQLPEGCEAIIKSCSWMGFIPGGADSSGCAGVTETEEQAGALLGHLISSWQHFCASQDGQLNAVLSPDAQPGQPVVLHLRQELPDWEFFRFQATAAEMRTFRDELLVDHSGPEQVDWPPLSEALSNLLPERNFEVEDAAPTMGPHVRTRDERSLVSQLRFRHSDLQIEATEREQLLKALEELRKEFEFLVLIEIEVLKGQIHKKQAGQLRNRLHQRLKEALTFCPELFGSRGWLEAVERKVFDHIAGWKDASVGKGEPGFGFRGTYRNLLQDISRIPGTMASLSLGLIWIAAVGFLAQITAWSELWKLESGWAHILGIAVCLIVPPAVIGGVWHFQRERCANLLAETHKRIQRLYHNELCRDLAEAIVASANHCLEEVSRIRENQRQFFESVKMWPDVPEGGTANRNPIFPEERLLPKIAGKMHESKPARIKTIYTGSYPAQLDGSLWSTVGAQQFYHQTWEIIEAGAADQIKSFVTRELIEECGLSESDKRRLLQALLQKARSTPDGLKIFNDNPHAFIGGLGQWRDFIGDDSKRVEVRDVNLPILWACGVIPVTMEGGAA